MRLHSISSLRLYTKYYNNVKIKKINKIYYRRDSILAFFKGKNVLVHNGKRFINILVTEKHLGFSFGAFAVTRVFPKHKEKFKDKKIIKKIKTK